MGGGCTGTRGGERGTAIVVAGSMEGVVRLGGRASPFEAAASSKLMLAGAEQDRCLFVRE